MRRREADGDAAIEAAPGAPAPGAAHGMRMAELSARSGVARETIHFYLREGLLPRPRKGGRTVAYYDEEHLDRLRVIRRLREEKYLPLAVIKRLVDSPAAAERDVDALAEVLHIIPDEGGRGAPPSAEAVREAEARGLLGRQPGARAADAVQVEPAERRVLAAVEEALALEGEARRLTLSDLEACAESLTALVSREADLFFDAVFRIGDVTGSIAALRDGRAPVARFIAAYRDLMLRRTVEELLVGLEQGPEAVIRAATVPISAAAEAALGVPERRRSLMDAAIQGGEDEARALVWHLFGTGAAAALAELPAEIRERAGARLGPLVAWGAHESARGAATLADLERAAGAAPDLALGGILVGEAIVARGVRHRAGGRGLLEEAIPALHRVISVDPEGDPEPVARAFGWFHRGRLELALPAVLGRKALGAAALERALALAPPGGAEREGIEPAARVRIAANALLSLGRHHGASGDRDRARALLDQAAALDPEGAIGRMARDEIA